MTQHVRTTYQGHRKTTWAVVLTLAVAAALAALALVLPALGATGQPIPPPSFPGGVTPTEVNIGGSNFSCTANTGGTPSGLSTFQVSGPPNSAASVTYNLPNGVTLTLTGVNGQNKGKLFSFSMNGARVFHLGVKGGTNHAWYNYSPGGVVSDGNLHATLQSPGVLYAASITTFCYARVATISGTVYSDLNGNGARNTSSPNEPGLPGWTVTAYNGSGSAVATAGPTGANGSYTLSNLPLGATYSVCATPSSGLWALTEPTTTPSRCSSSPGGQGWSVDLSADATRNFGAQSGVTPTCGAAFSGQTYGGAAGNVLYEAQLMPHGTECKDNFVVMYSYLPDTNQLFATLHPPTQNNNDPWEVVEHIHWTGITLDTQNPITLWYDDSFPYDGNPHTDLVQCNEDPRDPNGNPFVLLDHGDLTPGAETSCMLSSTDSAGAGPDDRSYDAWIYSNVDGTRGH
jgi:hypothetical protein